MKRGSAFAWLWLVAGLLAVGCAGGPVGAPAGTRSRSVRPPPPAQPIALFPSLAELQAIATAPVTSPKIATTSLPIRGWIIDPSGVSTNPTELWKPVTAWDRVFSGALEAKRRDARVTRALSCAAREIGLFFLEQRDFPPEALKRFILGACGAIAPIVHTRVTTGNVSRVSNADEIRERIGRLHQRCGEYAGRGKARVEFTPGGTILTSVNLNGTLGRFVVDTGATYVALTPEFAAKAGAEPAPGAEILLHTANGLTTGRPVTIARVALQGASAAQVSAVVMKRLPEGVDGLLGMSFLSRFELSLARREGTLELGPRGQGPTRSARP